MSKDKISQADDIRPEYDFCSMKGGVRGKYVDRYRQGTNIVVIDPDVAKYFPTDQAVNEALRTVIRVTQQQVNIAP
ncbi:MAG: hypothetical protein JW808_03290 [Victivallales bacterium]|nr:hypothetical protein [Victivallales bacterium]